MNLHPGLGSELTAALQARFVTEARRRLADCAGDRLHGVSEAALAALESTLLRRLSDIAAPTFAIGTGDNDRFDRVLAEFPVLARLLETVTDFWVDTGVQFLERLAADREILGSVWGLSGAVSQIMALTAGLSDPHHHGQTVWKVTWASGVTLFYKPRPLDLDAAWFGLLGQINGTGLDLPFACPRLVNRGAYGWMEAVAAHPCETQGQAASYYRRIGRLLCLLYGFGGSDFQQENVIACADQPVLVDLETLLTPAVRGQEFRLRPQRVTETVLRTHLLACWERAADGEWHDRGGMNALRLPAGMPCAWEAWAAAVQAGFREMADWLAAHRADIHAALTRFEGLRLRVIFQDTWRYQRALRRSLQPRFLKDERDRRAELERLLALPGPPDAQERHAPRLRQEVAMLESLDIPYFETRTDSADLPLASGETLRDYFVEPVCQTLRRTFQQFDATELARQAPLIQAIFDFQAARAEEPPPDDWTVPEVDDLLSLEAVAIALAEQVKQMAVSTTADAVTWLIPEDLTPTRAPSYHFRPCDSFLYQGVAGVALFLAVMETARPNAGYGELAQSALRPLAGWLHHPWLPPSVGIGAAHGLGGLVYALGRIGQCLAQPALLEQAQQVAGLITPERIAADERLDVFDGAAGALLGLLTLYTATRDEQVLRQAQACGDHLLAQRTPTAPRAWLTIRAAPVSGLSHGIAGIAYALLRLFQVTGDERLRQAALEGMAYERRTFSAEAGNWRAFDSSPEQPVFWTTYCHGAPGVGLARVGGLAGADTPDIRAEIAAAVQTTATLALEGLDFLCCGNFGRLELLLSAGLRLSQPDLIALARRQAARLAAQHVQIGGFRLFEELPPRVINPGLFRGIAGIGYELLRLSTPERWPNLLLWE